MSVASIRIKLVRQTSLNIPDPRGNISVLIYDALQAATITPVVQDNAVKRVLGSNDLPKRIVEFAAPASEAIARPFRIKAIVGDLFVRTVRVGDFRDAIQCFCRIPTDRIVIDRDAITF